MPSIKIGPNPHSELGVLQLILKELHSIKKVLEVQTLSQQLGDIAIMADLSALTAAVERETTVTASAVALIQQIAEELRAAATDPAAVQALADQLTSSSDALAAAVEANTL